MGVIPFHPVNFWEGGLLWIFLTYFLLHLFTYLLVRVFILFEYGKVLFLLGFLVSSFGDSITIQTGPKGHRVFGPKNYRDDLGLCSGVLPVQSPDHGLGAYLDSLHFLRGLCEGSRFLFHT